MALNVTSAVAEFRNTSSPPFQRIELMKVGEEEEREATPSPSRLALLPVTVQWVSVGEELEEQ